MTVSLFRDKKITVFGLGLNSGGVGTVKFLARHGAKEIIVTDMKSRAELEPSLRQLVPYKQVRYVLGQHRPEDFTRVDMVIKNPAILWTNEYIRLAQQHHIPVEMDSSIFFRLCRAPIIGVTGTKGKTTIATLIAHILEQAGRSVVRVGISQVSVLPLLEDIHEKSIVVFELSSWRLSALKSVKKSPHIAVLTNLYPDHLNYYKTMAAYAADKENIFRFQKQNDVLVANLDNEFVRTMAQDAPGQTVFASLARSQDGAGAWLSDETLWVADRGQEKVLLPVADIPLRGEHNVINVLLAALAALSAGLSVKDVRSGIKSFSGVSDRLELVATKNQVTFYNDSAATIPDAVISAIRSFSEPVVLIAGGSDKNLNMSELASVIKREVKEVVFLPGAGTEKLLAALQSKAPQEDKGEFSVAQSMTEAVKLAFGRAVPGDIVLLSPGAASFGLFQNEFDRGEQFRKAVKNL